MLKKFALILFWIAVAFAAGRAQVPWFTGLSRGEDLSIKLVTFGPGDDIPSYWGHTALIVEDARLHVSKIYNFGLYSFDRAMLLRFLKGRLIFSGGVSSAWGYLTYYRNQNRDVRIAVLNLPAKKKLWLARQLAISVLPENKNYVYDHYRNNCSTRLRDFIDRAVDGQFFEKMNKPGRMTLRQHTRRYIARNVFLEMALMYLMNDDIDRPIRVWDEMFLPDELERDVRQMSYVDSTGRKRTLVQDYFVFYQAKRAAVPAAPPVHWPGALVTGVLLGLIAVFLTYWWNRQPEWKRRVSFATYHLFIATLLGVPGLVLTLLASFTEHTVTYHNENLLLANILTFLLIPVSVGVLMDRPKAYLWLRYLWYLQALGSILALIVKLFPPFDQDNWLVMAFMSPINIGMALSVFWFKQPDVAEDVRFIVEETKE